MIGKWHLGFYNWDSTPTYRGFDTFYGFYSGAEDHYTHVQDHYLDLRDNEEIVRDLNGTYSVNAFAKVNVKAKRLNWESVHTCCPTGVPEVQYSLWALMWTRCFLRMILDRIQAWWMCYYVHDRCDIMFQSGRPKWNKCVHRHLHIRFPIFSQCLAQCDNMFLVGMRTYHLNKNS